MVIKASDDFFKDAKEKVETIYLLESINKPYHADSVARIGGVPLGVDEKNWPMFDGSPMKFLFTLDFETMPLFQKEYPEYRAVSLFISSYKDNEAFSADTEETSVLFLTQEDIDNHAIGQSYQEESLTHKVLEITPVKIPLGLLTEDVLEMDKTSKRYKLYNAIYNASYAGATPIWMQGAEYNGDFICQFDNRLIDDDELNIAYGIMYVFDDVAFWQC